MATGDSIGDFEQFTHSLRDFTWLAPKYGGTDIDRYIERNGSLLFLEGKHWDHGVKVPIGQHIAFKVLAQVHPRVSMWLVGTTEDEDTFYVMPFGRIAPLFERKRSAFYPPVLFTKCSRMQLEQRIEAWWHSA